MISPKRVFHTFTFVTLVFRMQNAFVDAAQGNLSDQCYAENQALADNTAVTSAAPYLECIVLVDIEDSCTVDFDPVSDAFKDACLDAGGQYYTVDVKFECSALVYGTRYNVEYNYLSYPACVGASCTDAELNMYYTDVVHPALESELILDGMTCEVTDRNEMTVDSNGNVENLRSAESSAISSNDVISFASFSIISVFLAFVSI